MLEFNSTVQTLNNESCPLNEFCSAKARFLCLSKQLHNCEFCKVSIAYALVAVYMLLGVAIFVGNGLIVTVYVYRYTQKVVEKSDPIRLSLAAVDLLSGVQIFTSVLPELLRKTNLTGRDHLLLFNKANNTDSWQCGVLLVFCFSASLYHLLLFGVQRFYAVAKPWSYKRRTLKSVYVSLTFVWLLAIFTTAIPGLLPGYFYYCRRISLCFLCSRSYLAHFLLYAVFLFLPFFIMTAISLITGVLAHRKLKQSLIIQHPRSGNARLGKNAFTQQQFTAFKTVLAMQAGFTITVGPAALGIVLGVSGISCAIVDPYEVVVFLLYFANSLVNAVVYGVRDKKFRHTLIYLLSPLSRTRIRKTFQETENTQITPASSIRSRDDPAPTRIFGHILEMRATKKVEK